MDPSHFRAYPTSQLDWFIAKNTTPETENKGTTFPCQLLPNKNDRLWRDFSAFKKTRNHGKIQNQLKIFSEIFDCRLRNNQKLFLKTDNLTVFWRIKPSQTWLSEFINLGTQVFGWGNVSFETGFCRNAAGSFISEKADCATIWGVKQFVGSKGQKRRDERQYFICKLEQSLPQLGTSAFLPELVKKGSGRKTTSRGI